MLFDERYVQQKVSPENTLKKPKKILYIFIKYYSVCVIDSETTFL